MPEYIAYFSEGDVDVDKGSGDGGGGGVAPVNF